MKIEVGRINDNPIEIEEDIPAASWQLDSFDIKFVDNIHLGCKFSRLGREILVDAEITVCRVSTCSRCLEDVRQTEKYDFNLNYNLSSLGDYLDIDEDMRQEILLNFPMRVLCRNDCKGICAGCGINLNNQRCRCSKKVNPAANAG